MKSELKNKQIQRHVFGDTLTLYFIPYAYLTQCDLERTQGCSEKNNYNEPYGEQSYISANTLEFSLQENGVDTE